MRCGDCGERMQSQTEVLVTRRRFGRTSAIQPSWYCWTCKASTADQGERGAAKFFAVGRERNTRTARASPPA